MATLENLEKSGVLARHSPDLEYWEMPERFITYTKDFGIWLEKTLRQADTKRGRNLSPYEQVEQIFYDFVIGNPMAYSVDYRKLDPLGQHIWELKTEDMRVFGWFVRKRHFLVVCGEFKDKIPRAKFYKPYIQRVCDFRAALPLDEPKVNTGVSYNDVL